METSKDRRGKRQKKIQFNVTVRDWRPIKSKCLIIWNMMSTFNFIIFYDFLKLISIFYPQDVILKI